MTVSISYQEYWWRFVFLCCYFCYGVSLVLAVMYQMQSQSQVDTMRFGMEQEIERRLLRKMNTSVAVIFMNRWDREVWYVHDFTGYIIGLLRQGIYLAVSVVLICAVILGAVALICHRKRKKFPLRKMLLFWKVFSWNDFVIRDIKT